MFHQIITEQFVKLEKQALYCICVDAKFIWEIDSKVIEFVQFN
jgi:hypothetical protein